MSTIQMKSSKIQALQTAQLKCWCRIRRCHNPMDFPHSEPAHRHLLIIYNPYSTKTTRRSQMGQESYYTNTTIKFKLRKTHSSFHPRFLLGQLKRSKLSHPRCGLPRSLVRWAPTVARLKPLLLNGWPRARRLNNT